MPLVVDASIVVCWAFDDEDQPLADLARSQFRSDEAIVPSLLWFEVRNALLVSERRKRITEGDTLRVLRDLARMPITEDRSPVEGEVLRLARTRRLTFYDAAYLELAQRLGLPLATLDRELADAARGEGVPLLGD